MRRNKHTQYRTRLFEYRMIMIRKKLFVITKHFVIDLFKKKHRKIKQKPRKKDSQVDCLHGIG